ncbi:MAG TPA: haloacid dehalogenase type II [Candidatus Limnocylindrales bacterium]|nr:haloacid dehalogenase type II [Candidatus Limnocylindrales bacterium]
MKIDVSSIRALTFDVFGTVVDWRTSLIEEGMQFGKSKGIEVDWAKFADAWRGGYAPAMDRVRRGELPWMKIDALHRMILDQLLNEFNIVGLSLAEKDHLNRVWHRLKPWPDAVSGLERLRRRFIVSTLSNGNISLLVNMARNAGLPWDCILSAELAKHYKPDKEVYQMAAELLDLRPDQILMVAAHNGDLKAAKNVGFKTAFVQRPLEFGPSADKADLTPDPSVDLSAGDFNDLADKLGV